MNSTGSGKSSTVSSVSELLDLYEEDPEEILLNLGFGREEPDLSTKIPSRFFNNTSSARGIDIKVYLAAQLQRMELENPNYALTSRFRQIEVLTTVANEFFQLYSQVSGQPIQRISSKDQGGERGGDEDQSPMKRSNSALNVAKLLKKTISKHNLLGSTAESPEVHSSKQLTQLNGSATSPDQTSSSPAQDRYSTDPDQVVETVSQKPLRKKDIFSLATVTEETSTDGETDRPTDNSPEQNSTEAQHQPKSADLQSTNQRTGECGPQAAKENNNFTSTPENAPSTLAPPQLAQLRTENTDSFDMEEIQTNEDEALPSGTSRTTDLSRTVSQQSDSSGFAEEPSVDSSSYLKVQESCDSCDSETTVTSHPSQDIATPHALDQLAFDLPDAREEEAGPAGFSMSREEHAQGWSSEQVPPGTAHHLHRNQPTKVQQEEEVQPNLVAEASAEHKADIIQTISASEQKPQHNENLTETLGGSDLLTKGVEEKSHVVPPVLDDSGSPSPSDPASPVLSALSRARQKHLSRTGQHANPQRSDASPTKELQQRRRGATPLQRSVSLPSSLLSPARVVSSVRIQFDHGQASCTPPRYSYKYTQNAGGDSGEEEVLEEKNDRGGSCLSTLIIKPGSTQQPPAAIPPKPIPRYLTQAAHSLQSFSPPPDWSPGGQAQTWSTQSVPDFSSNQSGQNIKHSLHSVLSPPSPGIFPGQGSNTLPVLNLHSAPGSGPTQNPSNTEMQLRRVLHEIRGTVQSLNQNRVDPPDRFEDHGPAASSLQSLAEFQLKRRSLNMFRSQMMDLELSIMRQQALVYRHLSPADRLEAEQLQSLRTSVREELQELEQQVEDRLMELTRLSGHRGLHRGSSVDSLCASSALRAIDPMSDLIREQLFLQSELGYNASTDPSTRSSSPVRGGEGGGGAGKQKPGVYRASISITPAPPPRPDIHTEEEEESGGVCEGHKAEIEGGIEEAPEEEGASVRFKVENFQQLIREIRESVAQEVRREIYNELLAVVSPRRSPLHTRDQPL
ncbi:protein ITPRID2 [Xenentodon cancila]